MSTMLLGWALAVAQLFLGLAAACAVFRILAGPRAQDRVLGLDTLYTNVLLILLTFGIRSGTTLYFDAALVIAFTGFVATTALARFLCGPVADAIYREPFCVSTGDHGMSQRCSTNRLSRNIHCRADRRPDQHCV